MKKKILIIDDDPDNLNGAKDFFSTVPDFDFVYAESKEEGLQFLNECVAVITDAKCGGFNCSFYNTDEVKRDVLFSLKDKAGYYLLLKARHLGKPAILVTEHGRVTMLVTQNVELETEILNLLKSFESDEGATFAECLLFLGYCEFGFNKVVEGHPYISKNKMYIDSDESVTSSAWELAWKILSKQLI